MERKAFLIVSKEVLADKRLSVSARLLYSQLLDHRNRKTGQCYPKQTTLSRELGVSLDTIQRSLRALEKHGFVTIKRAQYGCSYEIQIPQNAVSQTAQCGVQIPQNQVSEAPVSLYEPDLIEPKAAAAASVLVMATAAAAAPLSGGAEPKPDPETPAQKLVRELMPKHPEPGNLQKAVAEVAKILAARPGEVEAIRRSWAAYGPDRFIPQFWRWLHDGDWQFPPVERKGELRESWLQRRERERKEADEESYRSYAERGMWDALREYGGDALVEVWREKIKAAG
jgi:hypothetical protein